MKDIESDFISESIQAIEKADNSLIELENNPQDLSKIDEIFRIVHSIKGTSGFFELKKLNSLSNSTENVLSALKNGTININSSVVSLLLESIETLRNIILFFKDNQKEPEDNFESLIDKHKKIVEQPKEAESSSAPKTLINLSPLSIENNSLRVKNEAVEKLVQTLADLVMYKNYFNEFTNVVSTNNYHFHDALSKINHTINNLQEQILDMKLQPIGLIWTSMPRFVRNLSQELKKKVKISFQGEQTSMDKLILEKIKNPLIHIMRNAIDHGIELPEDRIAKDKSEIGSIELSAYYEKGHIVVKIADDGAGLDLDKIKKKALEKGLFSEETLNSMSNKDLFQLILYPGFSTSSTVNNISGRGVGMDVVEKSLEEIHGSLEIDSSKDQGTTIYLNIPITLALVKVLLVESQNKKYAIPEINVIEVIDTDSIKLEEFFYDRNFVNYKNKTIPCRDLNEVLGYKNREKEFCSKNIIICSVRGGLYGLLVEKALSLKEFVLTPIPSILSAIQIFQGCILSPDSKIILILNINKIMHGLISNYAPEINEKFNELSNDSIFLINENQAIQTKYIEKIIEIEANKIKIINRKKFYKAGDDILEIKQLSTRNNNPARGSSNFKAIIVNYQTKKLILLLDDYSNKILNDFETTDKPNLITYNKKIIELIDIKKIVGRSK